MTELYTDWLGGGSMSLLGYNDPICWDCIDKLEKEYPVAMIVEKEGKADDCTICAKATQFFFVSCQILTYSSISHQATLRGLE